MVNVFRTADQHHANADSLTIIQQGLSVMLPAGSLPRSIRSPIRSKASTTDVEARNREITTLRLPRYCKNAQIDAKRCPIYHRHTVMTGSVCCADPFVNINENDLQQINHNIWDVGYDRRLQSRQDGVLFWKSRSASGGSWLAG